MTVFLAVVDRKRARLHPSFENLARTRDTLEATAGRYGDFLGSDYSTSRSIEAANAGSDVHVLHWQRKLLQGSFRRSGNYWAISAGHQVSDELLNSVRPRGGTLEYVSPVWGHYSTVFGTSTPSQVFAWNTTPALEAVHWAATEDYVLVSNRPLLVALFLSVLTNQSSPELSTDYLAEYLLYGYSLSGRTPFKNVHTLSVNSALAITNGNVRITDVPKGMKSDLRPDHTLNEGVEALYTALTNAMDRTEKEISGRPVQLRLSGGKDSRLLLALLRERKVDLRTVTFGGEASVDVRLASRLNEMAGIRGEMRSPRPTAGDTIVERIEQTIHESGGLPASQAHTAQYRGSDPEKPHEAIMMGQWPLYKGGMATRTGLTTDEINHVLKWQGGNLLRREVRAPFDADLVDWSSKLTLSDDLEKLYLFAREFRSGRYLHAHINQYAGDSMIAYPLADAEVGAVCDALSMYEKVSEKALFGALQKLWPDVMKVPLDRSTWRFEKNGPDPNYSGPWFDDRHSPVPNSKPGKITTGKRGKSEYSDEVVFEMSSHIVRSENAQILFGLLSQGMVKAIVKAAQGEISGPRGMPDRTFKKFIWRVCVADVWLSKRWLSGSHMSGE